MTVAADPPTPARARPARPRGPDDEPAAWRLLATVPTAVPLALAAYGLVAMVLVLAGQFRPALVLPLGALAAAGAVLAGGTERSGPSPRPGSGGGTVRSRRERRGGDLLALLLAAGSAAVNVHYGSRDVEVHRDPGIYATTGAFLLHHHSLVIQTDPQVFGSLNPATWAAAGYGPVGGHGQVYAQGMHLLPALIASVGFVLGGSRALWTPALLGAGALLAVYGVGRELARPRWALLVTALLAGILPELYVARDTFTESADQLLIFGALALLRVAHRSGRDRDALLAGLVVGACTLTRIDGYLTLDALLGVAVLLLCVAGAGAPRRAVLRGSVLIAAAALPAGVVSYLDVTRLSSGYYHSERGSILALLALGAALVGLGLVVVPAVWRWGLAARLDRLTARGRRPAGVLVVLAAAGLLASRPWWYVGRDSTTNIVDPLVGGLQLAAHVARDPTRSYAEQTVSWLSWYLGPVAVVLAVLGLCVLVWRLLDGRSVLALPFVAVVAATTGLYLVAPHISPDQMWATRRFVPVTFPGLALCAAVALDRLPATWWGRGAAALAVPLLLIPPALVSAPLFRQAQYRAEASLTRRLCALLPSDAAVVYTDAFGPADMPTERAYCGHPAETLLHATAAQLAATRAVAAGHGYRLYLVSISASAPERAAGTGPVLLAARISSWAITLVAPPRRAVVVTQRLFVGPVTAAGLLG
jgi:hypothetical protein